MQWQPNFEEIQGLVDMESDPVLIALLLGIRLEDLPH